MSEKKNESFCVWGMKIEGYLAYMVRVLKELWGFTNYLNVIRECLRIAYRLNCFSRYFMNNFYEEASCIIAKILRQKYGIKLGIPRELCQPIVIRNLVLEGFEYHVVKFLINLNGYRTDDEKSLRSAVRDVIIKSILLAFVADVVFYLFTNQYNRFVATGNSYEALRRAMLEVMEKYKVAIKSIDEYAEPLHERCLRSCSDEEVSKEITAPQT